MTIIEKTKKSKVLYKGKILSLKRDKVELINGETTFREVVTTNGGACVLCVTDGKIPLVNQYRYPYQMEIWEIPAGKIDVGEEAVQCAKRELREETGLIAGHISLMTAFYPSPGYTNEVIYIYYVNEVLRGEQCLDSDEFLRVKYFTPTEIEQMIINGVICDGKTIAAFLYYKQFIEDKKLQVRD